MSEIVLPESTATGEVTTSDCPIEDLADFRLDGDYAARTRTLRHGYVALFRTKSLKNCYFHIKPGEQSCMWVSVVDYDGNLYMVANEMRAVLREHIGTGALHTVMTVQGQIGLWYTPHRAAGKGESSWNDSALELATVYASFCIRLHSNTDARAYEAETPAPGTAPTPEWPDIDLHELMRRAFGTRVIASADHPVAQALLAAGAK